jgi:hypothetical protein
MSIELTGIYTPALPETRDLAYLRVIHNNTEYAWQAYVPRGVDIGAYIASIETKVKAEIDAREAEWVQLDPKHREIVDPFSGEPFLAPIDKSEIVKPEIPDYYAKRRDAYPAIGDQLDAIWKGTDSPEFTNLLERIAAVKAQFPK